MPNLTDRFKLALGLGKKPKRKITPDDRRGSGLTDLMSATMSRWGAKKKLPSDRLSLYRDYDDLDDIGSEIGSFLDAVSAEATQINEGRGHKVWFTSKNKKVQDRIEDLMYFRLKVDDWLTALARSLAKYGDEFGENLMDDAGVQSIFWGNPLSSIARVDLADGQLAGFTPTDEMPDLPNGELTLDKFKTLYKPWDFTHFRIKKELRLNAEDASPVQYGTSLLRRARRPAYRWDIIGDLLLLFRAGRASDRMLLEVDVTGQVPEEQIETVNRWRSWLNEITYKNQNTGEYRSQGNPLALGENIIWPKTRDSVSSVQQLQGNPNLHEAVDVDMAISQLAGALGCPKEMLGYEGNLDQSKPFSAQNVGVAKVCFGLQSALLDGLAWIIRVDLAIAQEELGLSDEDLVDPGLFYGHMVPPSAILHLHRLEALRDILDATSNFNQLGTDLGFEDADLLEWRQHALSSILGMADFDIERFVKLLDKKIRDAKKAAKDADEAPPEDAGTGAEPGAEEEPGQDLGLDLEAPADEDEPVDTAEEMSPVEQWVLTERGPRPTPRRPELPRRDKFKPRAYKDRVVKPARPRVQETRDEDEGGE